MSKREMFKDGRRKARRSEEEDLRGGRDRMLGKKSRMNYGAGPSRVPARQVEALLREAQEENG